MEKLTAAQQQSVKKMSDERLRLKLVAAGYEEDVVVAMERETMLSTYAEFLASGGVRPGAAAQAGYDPEVEAQKLAFEKQKWEAQLRREEAEREEKRAEREEKKAEREDKLRRCNIQHNYVKKRLREKLNYVKKRQNSVDGKLIE